MLDLILSNNGKYQHGGFQTTASCKQKSGPTYHLTSDWIIMRGGTKVTLPASFPLQKLELQS
jgi:hypothetical protein